VSSGQNTHICYAEGTVYVCSAAIVLSGTEGKVRLCIKKRA